MKVLVTGSAGFIGYHLSQRLLSQGNEVVGLDNLNHYYDVSLKYDRLKQLQEHPNFQFYRCDLSDRDRILKLFQRQHFDRVVNLAAQAGVRYSIDNPYPYIDSNIVGFINVLEGCRHSGVEHLVFASSSSVYGANTKIPFSVRDRVDHPVSLYAATKRANELMAHSYSHLYNIPTTGLRFFTVYGPWGRPDMALFLFTKAILARQAINVFNRGNLKRDFTYIDDIIEGVIRVLATIPEADSTDCASTSQAPYRLYNIGNHQPIELMTLIETLEDCLGIKAIKNMLPMQAGDVLKTYADVDDLVRDVGFKPDTSIERGVQQFVDWYCSYYQIQNYGKTSAGGVKCPLL